MDFCVVENSVLLICQSAERNAVVITRLIHSVPGSNPSRRHSLSWPVWAFFRRVCKISKSDC